MDVQTIYLYIVASLMKIMEGEPIPQQFHELNPGILGDKTMYDNLMFIPNDNKQSTLSVNIDHWFVE